MSRVVLVSRRPAEPMAGIEIIAFDDAAAAIGQATHLLATKAPIEEGDPVLVTYRAEIAAAPALRWLGYLSSTGVYGNHNGRWVDETTPPKPTFKRSRQRVAAEDAWAEVAAGRAFDIFRLAGIYGPGRSAFDDIASGAARRIIKPGHQFGRIHRDDIVRAVLAAMTQLAPRRRVLNLNDDRPAESAEVLTEAARLLGVPPPPEIPFEEAQTNMSAMAHTFWADNRKVSSAATQEVLGLTWRYPSYREGLRAILAEQGSQQQS